MPDTIFEEDRLHIIASDSGSGWLKVAAREDGVRLKNILCFSRLDLISGPVAGSLDPAVYIRWADANAPGLRALTLVDEDSAALTRLAWDKALSWKGPISLWYSSKSVQEISFYVAFLFAFPDPSRVDVVDVAIPTADGKSFVSIGECTPELIGDVWANRKQLTSKEAHRQRSNHATVADHPGALRTLHDGELSIAALDHFDSGILDQLDDQWRPLSPIMTSLFERERENGFRSLEHFYVLWRFLKMQENGRIELQGDISEGETRRAKVRLRTI